MNDHDPSDYDARGLLTREGYDRQRAARLRPKKGPVEHRLKTWLPFYEAVEHGVKSFEIRRADRDFRSGDILILQEYDPHEQRFTGRECSREVMYVLKGGQFGLEAGYVCMGIAAHE